MLEALCFQVVCLSFHYWDNQPTDFPSICPAIHLKILQGIFLRTHGRNCLKFGMMIYPDHLQSKLNFRQDLSIFLILGPLWFETGQIWGFQLFLHNKRNDFILKQKTKYKYKKFNNFYQFYTLAFFENIDHSVIWAPIFLLCYLIHIFGYCIHSYMETLLYKLGDSYLLGGFPCEKWCCLMVLRTA